MNSYTFRDIATSNDRHKLYTLICSPDDLTKCIDFVRSEKINTINIGRELATYIDTLDDLRYLNIDVHDYTKRLLDKHKSKINGAGNDVVAIYNLGILMEPALELNAVHLLKEFSKSTSLIIIWENHSEIRDRLNWATQKNNVFLDFTETQIKKLQYAI